MSRTEEAGVRRFVRESSLSLFFGLLFLLALAGQAIAGWKQYNAEQEAGGFGRIGIADYLTSADWAVDVAENWQSEYLQFTLYIVLTVWLLQRGSPESKELDKAGGESDKDQKLGRYARADSPAWAKTGGLRTRLYSNSLVLVMASIFVASWLIQSVAGQAAYNETRLQDLQAPVGWAEYLSNPDFWARTLQNWQSEFLAIGTMVVFSVYLRQRGSPQSKPVGEPHASTGVEG
jgi:hypothetical protein